MFLINILIFFICFSSIANDNVDNLSRQNNPHIYSGIRIDWANFDGCTAGYSKCNDKAYGYGFYSGYQLNNWLSLEMFFDNYNKIDATYNNETIEADILTLGVSSVFSYDLTDKLDVFFKLNLSNHDIKREASWKYDKYESNPFGFGLGGDFILSKNWSIRGEYNIGDFNLVSLGLSYHFSQNNNTVNLKQKHNNIIKITETSTHNKSVNVNKESIFFEFNSYDIESSNLDNLLEMITNSKGVISIHGYSDNTGSEKYNLSLSKQRAIAVANYLIYKGVHPTRIKVYSYGESRPSYENNSKINRAKNRRVDIILNGFK